MYILYIVVSLYVRGFLHICTCTCTIYCGLWPLVIEQAYCPNSSIFTEGGHHTQFWLYMDTLEMWSSSVAVDPVRWPKTAYAVGKSHWHGSSPDVDYAVLAWVGKLNATANLPPWKVPMTHIPSWKPGACCIQTPPYYKTCWCLATGRGWEPTVAAAGAVSRRGATLCARPGSWSG
jgi:hypothetical protein